MLPEIPSKNQQKAETNLRLNDFQIVTNESQRIQGVTIDMPEIT